MKAGIRAFRPRDEAALVELWDACGLTRPWNNPNLDIERKRIWDPDRLLIAEVEGVLVGSTMVGYDGHRGWLYYVAVHPEFQGSGLGRQLVDHASVLLRSLGCAKVNLQVRSSNSKVIAFYEHLGFEQDDVISLGRRLIHDLPHSG